jgi:hypothetical protein
MVTCERVGTAAIGHRNVDGAANQLSRHFRTELDPRVCGQQTQVLCRHGFTALYLGSFRSLHKAQLQRTCHEKLGSATGVGGSRRRQRRSWARLRWRGQQQQCLRRRSRIWRTIPFMANNGAGLSSDHGFSFRHGFGGNRRVGGFHGRDSNGFHAYDLGSSYSRDPATTHAWGPFLGLTRTRVTGGT